MYKSLAICYLCRDMNKFMKRILLLISIIALAVSCLGTGEFNTTYYPEVTFDYSDSNFNTDSLLFDTQYKIGFATDYFCFYHKIEESTEEFQGGFLVSKLVCPESGQTEKLKNNLYRTNVKTPMSWQNKYAVFSQMGNMPQRHFSFSVPASTGLVGTCLMKYVYVSNTVATQDAVRKTFVPGDQLILKATGYLGEDKTGEAEFKLAEFTTVKDSIVSTWTLFDLSKLGSVDVVMFDVQVPEGKDIPRAVCMDNLVGCVALEAK